MTVGAAFPNLAHSAGPIETRFATLIPQNVTRGVVTLERVRGDAYVWFDEAQLTLSLARWTVLLSMQLVPIRDGNIVNLSVLSSRNTGDLESNRFIWRRTYSPQRGTPIILGAQSFDPGYSQSGELDIKSKRRFDRALWALILVVDVDATAAGLHIISMNLRGLFRASDGL